MKKTLEERRTDPASIKKNNMQHSDQQTEKAKAFSKSHPKGLKTDHASSSRNH